MTAKTSAERAREYRARLREGKPPKKPAKTNAQRAREHRARKRALKPPKKPPKTNAERAREHRARVRALHLQVVSIMEPSKANADKARDYRAKMRASLLTKKEPKSQVQRNREWRERKKQLQQNEKLDFSMLLTNIDPSASNAVVSDKTETLLRVCKVPRSLLEYNRGWRERKKLHIPMQRDQHLDLSMPSTSTTSFASNQNVTDKIKAEHEFPESRLEHNEEWKEQQDQQLILSIPSTNCASSTSTSPPVSDEMEIKPTLPSAALKLHRNKEFEGKCLKNNHGSVCYICRRVLFANEMSMSAQVKDAPLLHTAFPDHNVNPIVVCTSCRSILKNCTIPTFSKSNGFANAELLRKEITSATRSDGPTNLLTTQLNEKPIVTIQPMIMDSAVPQSNATVVAPVMKATDNGDPDKEMIISTRNDGPLNLMKNEKPVIEIQSDGMDNEVPNATVVSSTITISDNDPQRNVAAGARNDGPINLIMRSEKRIIRIQSIKRTPSLNATTNQADQEKINTEIITQRQRETKLALFKQLEKTLLEMARSKPSKSSSTNVTTNQTRTNQEKNNIEMIAQPQATSELALGKHLEKTLLQMPRPTLLAPDLHFLPDVNSGLFAYFLGLDVVVDYLNGNNDPPLHSIEPIVCSECKTDFSATWRTIKRKRASQEQNSICDTCFSVTTKRSLKEEHNNRLKNVLVKALQQEKEIEHSSLSNVPVPQVHPQSSRSLLKPVSHHLQ